MAAKYLVFVASALLLLQSSEAKATSLNTGENLQQLQNTMEDIRSSFVDKVSSSLEQLRTELNTESSGLQAIISNGTTRIQGLVQGRQANSGDTFTSIQSNVQSFMDSVRDSLQQAGQQYLGASDNAGMKVEGILSGIKSYIQERRQDLENLRQQLQGDSGSQTSTWDVLRNQSLSGITNFISTLDMGSLNSSQMQEYSGSIQTFVNDMKERFDQGYADMQVQMQTVRDQVEGNVQQIIQRLSTAAANASTRFQQAIQDNQQQGSDNAIQQYAIQLQSAVNSLKDQVNSFAGKSQYDSQTVVTNIKEQMSVARQYLEETLRDWFTRINTSLQTFLTGLNNEVQNTARTSGNEASTNIQNSVSSWFNTLASPLNVTGNIPSSTGEGFPLNFLG